MPDKVIWILLSIFVIVFAVCIVILVRETKKKKMTKEEQDAYYEEYFANDGEVTLTYAEVVNLTCGTKVVGSKSPKCVESYVVTFRDQNGKIFNIDVDREMYDAIDIGMRGLLRLVDGHLNSFEPDNI